jgi:hypothetical protein
VKVYLLSINEERCLFYSEGPEAVAAAEPVAARAGLRGWVERKYKSLQVLLTESEEGLGLRMRRAWEWLQKRTGADEPLLRSLRGAVSVTLYHPPAFGEEEARKLWQDYLKSRQGRHTFWFVVDALTSPLTLIFAPLPGPNIIGYWFVYRSVCHLLARLGARRARCGEIETTFLPALALDGSFSVADEERIAGLEASFGLQGLALFIKRSAKEQRRTRGTTLAVS